MARKPQPTTLKLLKGNPGKRPLNADEARPDVQAPEPPADLAGEALEEWHRITAELVVLGLVTRIDRAALIGYCVHFARWMEAERKVAEGGLVVKVHGQIIPNPYLSVANTAYKSLISTASEFGLTPASRTRIKATPRTEKAQSKWAGMLPGSKKG